MSLHSYTKCWLHIVWGTLNREKFLREKETRKKISAFLYEYANSKNIFMERNYVNSDHVHALIDLPTGMSIEDTMHLLKGASSHWINSEKLCVCGFRWCRGYGAFSVSESVLKRVIKYIDHQEEHHRVKTFGEEYQGVIEDYGLKYSEDE